MIVTLLIWAYLTFITLAYGIGAVKFLHGWLKLQNEINISSSILAIVGLSSTAWLSSILSIFMKTGWFAHSMVLVGAIFLTFRYAGEIKAAIKREFSQRHWVYWMLFTLGGIGILLYAVKVPANPDTPLYHAQAIHWIEEFPVVPGLANLDARFGSNSNWFTVIALFSLSFLKLQSFHLVPSFLFLASFLYFLGGIQNILHGTVRLSDVLRAVFIPFAFYVLIDEISSPGTDLPVILFYWLILCLWVELIERDNESGLLQGIVFFFSVMAITYKVSGVLILLVAFWFLAGFIRRKEYRSFWVYVGIAGAVAIPWMIRNFVLSGYWLYPQPGMQFVSPLVDWRVPVDEVLSFKRGVQAWAIAPRVKWEDISGLSFQSRYTLWFANLTFIRKGIFILSLVSPALFYFIFLLFKITKKEGNHPSYLVVVLIGYLNLFFWLLTAPNFRFGYGFMLGIIGLVLALLIQFVFANLGKYGSFLAMVLVLILFAHQVYIMFGAQRDGTPYADYLVLPASYPHAASEPCNVGDLTIRCAKNWRQCGYDAFPCLPQAPVNVELRGDTIRYGFQWRKSK